MFARRSFRPDTPGTVYLVHYSQRTSQNRQHYLGWSSDVSRRFAQHAAGRGAKETKKALAEGLTLTLAQTWRGTPALERRLKEWSRRGATGFAGLCPFCGQGARPPERLSRELGTPSLVIRGSSPGGQALEATPSRRAESAL
jgi:predicted GIY-YIG superfamily endonuclease